MKKALLPRFVPALFVFIALLGAVLSAQEQKEELVLPDDPLAAIAEMPVQEPVKEGTKVLLLDEEEKPIRDASVVVMPTMDRIVMSKMMALERQVKEKYKGDQMKMRYAALVIVGQRYVTDANGQAFIPKMGPSRPLKNSK